MNVQFACPDCQHVARLNLLQTTDWQCPRCDSLARIPIWAAENGLHECALCGNGELYKKKDFPHWLGLTILTAACLGSILPYGLYHQWWTWLILIGSAAFDGLLYLWVGDVIVCYRCNAHFRHVAPNGGYKPFELGIAERYRQESIRRQQLEADKRSA